MRIEQLRYLVEIADCGTFTAAATRLQLAQPRISQAVSALEAELGIVLLQRTRAGSELTPTGMAVVEHARQILERVNEIKITANNFHAGKESSVAFAAARLPLALFVPEAIAAVRDARTDNSPILIREVSMKLAKQLIVKGEIDFAVTACMASKEVPDFVFAPILDSQVLALVSRDLPLASKKVLSFEEIQKYPVALGREEHISNPDILKELSAYGKPEIALRTQNFALLQNYVEHSGVVGLVFDVFLTNLFDKEANFKLIPIEKTMTVSYGILRKSSEPKSLLEARVIEEIKKAAQRHREQLDAYVEALSK